MIKKIYLAGGMANLNPNERNEWRKKFITILSQSKYTYGMNELEYFNPVHYPMNTPKAFYIHEIKSSDLLVVNFNDPKSIGTAQEIQCALDNDIPIVGIWDNEENKQRKILGKPPKKLHPWLEESCERIFDDLDECVDYIIEFYLEGRVIG